MDGSHVFEQKYAHRHMPLFVVLGIIRKQILVFDYECMEITDHYQ